MYLNIKHKLMCEVIMKIDILCQSYETHGPWIKPHGRKSHTDSAIKSLIITFSNCECLAHELGVLVI